MDNSDNQFDVMIGARLRQRRLMLQMSQTRLGEILGVSFQQVQKYEGGLNRMSGSTLLRACTALDIPLAAFFDGANNALPDLTADLLTTPQEVELLLAMRQIQSPKVRSAILNFVRLVAEGKR